MATHSSILAWRIPWTEELGKLQFMGLQRVGHNWVTNTFTFNDPEMNKFPNSAGELYLDSEQGWSITIHSWVWIRSFQSSDASHMHCPPWCRLCFWVGLVIASEKAVAPHSSAPAWKIPWMEKPGLVGCSLRGHWELDTTWATSLSLFTFMHWRRKWQPTAVYLPGESQGCGSLGGLLSMGSHRVRHDWSDLAGYSL